MLKKPFIWTWLTMAVFVTAGCGQAAQQGSSSHSAALTRAQLIAKADAICARVNVRRATITIVSPLRGYARFMPQFGAYAQLQYSQLHKLTPPRSLAADWRVILANTQRFAVNMIKSGEYAKAGDVRESHALFERAETGVERVNSTAAHDGFGDCARTG